jgi:hypothetical protein
MSIRDWQLDELHKAIDEAAEDIKAEITLWEDDKIERAHWNLHHGRLHIDWDIKTDERTP